MFFTLQFEAQNDYLYVIPLDVLNVVFPHTSPAEIQQWSAMPRKFRVMHIDDKYDRESVFDPFFNFFLHNETYRFSQTDENLKYKVKEVTGGEENILFTLSAEA